ncbi:hypothetical protein R3P38DRAFT_2793562 [Favolaschia claudopus]|uniref:Uncharacterized protein n=1 Tax=Favolaschia claudopus TaxID=2862362 RepID=A0AAW0AEP4_9AGAR
MSLFFYFYLSKFEKNRLSDSRSSTSRYTRSTANSPPEVPPKSGALRDEPQSGDGGKRGGLARRLASFHLRLEGKMTHKSPGTKRVRDTAKKEKFDGLKDKAESAVSLDELAEVLRESIGIMRTYNSAPTKTCFGLLDAIHERLAAHHELTDAVDDASTFSTVLSRAVVSPVKTLTAQVEAQQRAIQSLTK